jgi:ribokinase
VTAGAAAPPVTAPRIAVLGSANMDLVATASALPRPGETVLGRDFATVPGGKGANQAIAAVRGGASCVFLGAIGSDSFGVTLKSRLLASGVDTSLLRTVYGASGVAVIMVDGAGENIIVVTPGANASLVGLIEPELAAIAGADVLVAQLEVPVETVTAAMVAARAAGTRTVLNAAPARALPANLLAAVDLLVVNDIEAEALTGRSAIPAPTGSGAARPSARNDVGVGESGPSRPPDSAGVGGEDVHGEHASEREVLAALLELVPRAVLTRGAAGAWYSERGGDAVHVPAPPVESVDSTAAGDAFTGALAVALSEGREPIGAVRWACAAGAASVRRLGASSSLPQRAEIDELYASAYRRGR